MTKFIKSNWILLLILVTAAFFRFYQITTFPGGLFPDEAANGIDINSIFRGDVQPFYERGNGREALFFYLLAFSVSIFGRGFWQHHIVTALIGVAEVLVTYFLGKRLFGKRVAYLASFFMSISSYAVMLNRNAFRANMIPLFTTLTLLFLVKFFQTPNEDRKSKIWSAAFAGISFGLGFYTYISYRMLPVILVGLGILLLFAYRGQIWQIIKSNFKYEEAFAIGFILSFAWLGWYFLTHPGSFVGRASHVSIFNRDLNQGDILGTLLMVFKKTMLGFFTHGDYNWRHNVSGFPFLSPFISPLFAVALTWFTLQCIPFLKNVWNKIVDEQNLYKVLIAVWFWFMMVPEITTAEGIPHGLRLVGVIPSIFILSAWGVSKCWDLVTKTVTPKFSQSLLAIIFLGGLFYYNYSLVFVYAANSPDLYYAYRSDLTDVSNYLAVRNQKDKTYLSLDAFSLQTVEYLTTTTNNPYIVVDPARTYEVKLKKGDQVIFTQSSFYDRIKFLQYHPNAKLILTTKDKFNLPTMMVFEQQ
jgi:4-amino-4-deoxy-L-arabinose transferase-like glycosyltransferase